MSTTGDNRTGFVSRILLKFFGPAQITPADDEDRQAQRDHREHEANRPGHPAQEPPR